MHHMGKASIEQMPRQASTPIHQAWQAIGCDVISCDVESASEDSGQVPQSAMQAVPIGLQSYSDLA